MPALILLTTKQHAMIFNVSEIVALPESIWVYFRRQLVSVPAIRCFILDKNTRRPLDSRQTRQSRNVAQAAATRNSTEEA